MVQLDCRAAELSGSGLSIITLLGHTKPPLNVNDCDLYPDMSEPPTEQTKATEMMFILIRSTIGSFLIKEMPENEVFDGVWSTLSNPAVSIIAKDNVINELEATLEDKVVRHCDVQVPLHHLSFLVARSAICKLRLFAHLPRDEGDSPVTKTSPEEEDLLFNNSLRMLQYDTEIRSTKTLRRFLWHADMHFQWHALIYLLTYLRAHGEPNARTDTAWATIDGIFANHPEIIHGGQTRSKLCIAVGSLTLKAWEARETALRRSNPPAGLLNPPSCVRQLQGQQLGLQLSAPDTAEAVIPAHRVEASAQHQRHHSNGATGLQTDQGGEFVAMMASGSGDVGMSANESDLTGSYATPINWGQWDSMCQEFEMQSQWTTGFGPLDMFPQQQ